MKPAFPSSPRIAPEVRAEIERATRTLRGTEPIRADALAAANELFRDVVLGAQ